MAVLSPPEQAKHSLNVIGALLFAFVAVRHEVGGDWTAYASWLHSAVGVPFARALTEGDIGYFSLNWVVANGSGNIYVLNAVCAGLAISGIVYFCREQKNPTLALLVAIPYLIFVVCMGYTRQSVAIGLGAAAMAVLLQRRLYLYILLVLLAVTFHKAAAIYLLFAPLALSKPRRAQLLMFGAVMSICTAAIAWQFWDDIGNMVFHYWIATGEVPPSEAERLSLETGRTFENLSSIGAVPRIALAMASVAILWALIAKGDVVGQERRVWSSVALVVIVFFVLAPFRSTLADRLALFLYPLQIFAVSNFPRLFPAKWQPVAVMFVVAIMSASFGAWSVFGRSAEYWLPYETVWGK